MDTARREVLRAQRSTFLGLRQDGVISEDVHERLTAEIDATLDRGGDVFWFIPGESLPDRLKPKHSRVDVREITIEDGSVCDGKRVRELNWPENSVIASLRRGEKTLIVRGETIIQAGDILMLVADDDALQEIQNLCKGE
jgi:uncharacterized transporter YbjL